jgi:hypothetical protein
MGDRTEPTEEIIRREIAAARRILQEDRHHAALTGLTERFDKQYPQAPIPPKGTPPPPDPKNPPADPPAPRRSMWWGDES